MLNSVQQYLKGVLQGVAVPQGGSLTAYVQPPQLATVADGPVAYLWGARVAVNRQTAPRGFQGQGGGQQKFIWEMSCAVTQAIDPDDEYLDTTFPLVLDQIMATLMLTPLQQKGVWLTDPVTGNKTQLMSVGERFSLDYALVSQGGASGQGLWIFAADLTFPVEELVSFQPGTFYNPPAPSA